MNYKLITFFFFFCFVSCHSYQCENFGAFGVGPPDEPLNSRIGSFFSEQQRWHWALWFCNSSLGKWFRSGYHKRSFPPPLGLKKNSLRVAAITPKQTTTTLNPNVSWDVEKFYQHVGRCFFFFFKGLSNVYCNLLFEKTEIHYMSWMMEQIIACLPATHVHFFQICTLIFGQPVPKFRFYSSTCKDSRREPWGGFTPRESDRTRALPSFLSADGASLWLPWYFHTLLSTYT